MRIGVLARQLKVKPSEIIAFLNSNGIETDKGVNTKLVKAGIDRVMQKFDKHFESSFQEMEEKPQTEYLEQDSEEITEETFTSGKSQFKGDDIDFSDQKELAQVKEVLEEEKSEESEEMIAPPIEDEVIKPQLVKLQGLKIIGKIDIPEPKVKIKEETNEEDSSEESQPKVEVKKPRNSEKRREREYSSRPERRKRPPLTYEQKVKREEKLKAKEHADKIKKEKEKKRLAYEDQLKKNQSKSKVKSKKMAFEPEVINEVELEKPTSVWGKFMYWLNN